MHDLRYAVRNLKSTPGFAIVAIVSLALALAANTAVFSIVNALLLRPLAVENPDELAGVYRRRGAERWLSLSYGEYRDFAAGNRSFSGMTAFTVPGVQASLREPGTAAMATPIALVSGNYFEVLGLRPLRGRFFGETEDRRNASDWPIVISEELWRARFAAVDVLGRALLVNGRRSVIVGIMPAAFTGTFTALRTDVWIPLSAQPQVMPGVESIDSKHSKFLNTIGRLKPGVTRAQAEADLAALGTRLNAANPDTEAGLGITITETTGVQPFIRQIITGFLALMMGVVAAVLAVACGNLAGLLLARATSRARELAVRSALGASRARLVRQLMIEAILISAASALLGLLIARAALAGLLLTIPELGLPVHFDLDIDARVFAYSALLVIGTAVLFGVAPALQGSRVPDANVLREDAGGSRGRSRLRAVLLTAQIALSVLLLSTTVLLLRGIRRAGTIDIGFDPDRIALLMMEPGLLGYDAQRRTILYGQLLERVRAQPTVERAALAQFAPLGSRGDRVPVVRAGRPDTVHTSYNAFTSGFLSVLEIQLQQGRDFLDRDSDGAPGVAIVSEAMARQFWPGASALGQRFTVRGASWEVIGVVRDIKHGSIGEPARAMVYFPLLQVARLSGAPVAPVLHARSRTTAAALLPVVARELQAIDPDIPAKASLMARDVEFSLFPSRLAGKIVGACGILALVLAIVGLHAASAYNVARRTREFGIRIAVGASASDVSRLVLRQTLLITLIGLSLGLPLAIAGGSLMRSMLYGVPAADPLTYIIVAIILAFAIVLAGWAPVRRATRTDPMAVLRSAL
ncbi:MAG: ABC transporter permease [Gemmatimonadota bacterium]